jgi:hypothetical protein
MSPFIVIVIPKPSTTIDMSGKTLAATRSAIWPIISSWSS